MKTVFNIINNQSNATTIGRIVEISEEQLAFIYYSSSPRAVQQIKIFTLEKNEGNAHLADQLKQLFEAENKNYKNISQTDIYLNYKEVTLIPNSLHHTENGKDTLNFIFGADKSSEIQNEVLSNTDIGLLYRLSDEVNKAVGEFYPGSSIKHSIGKQFRMAAGEGSQIICMVGYSYAKILVFNNSNFLLLRYFHYATADDMAYELLNTCAQLNLDVAEVQLKLSGFIEADSNLYAALQKYFLNIDFEIIEESLQIKTEGEIYPPHLFYPLFQLLPNENY